MNDQERTRAMDENDKLTDTLSGQGVAWNDVEERKDGLFELGLYAVVHVEWDTNAAIVERVGDGDDLQTYSSEADAYAAAMTENRKRIEGAKGDLKYWQWIPDVSAYDESYGLEEA